MTTPRLVADRAMTDFIVPPDDQPVTFTLAAELATGQTSLSYDDVTLAPDEEELLSPGTLIEVGLEVCRITTVDFETNTLTVTRAVSGSTETTHPSGSEAVAAPVILRRALVDAVKDEVVGLYPDLHYTTSVLVTTTGSAVDVPAAVVTITDALWEAGDGRWQRAPTPDLLDPFPPSATGKAVQFREIPDGRDVYLTYRARFARPDDDDDLATIGVQPQWHRILAAGAAAQVVAGRPSDLLSAEYIVEQLEREAAPPGTAEDVRNGLLALRELWVREAQSALRADRATPVVYNPVVRR